MRINRTTKINTTVISEKINTIRKMEEGRNKERKKEKNK